MSDKKRILIVDDEAPIRTLLEASLKSNGYEVSSAADGKEGLQKALQEKPDLVILDIMMSGLDGGEVGSALKENSQTEDIPIIFLTGLKSEEEARESENSSNPILAKPVSTDKLIQKIEELLAAKNS